MIQRFSFGTMIATDSVVQKVPASQDPVPFLRGDVNGWQYNMNPKDLVYGLGETVRGLNKRGWHYASNCADDPSHTEDKMSLYGAHNFFVVSGQDGAPTFGVFVDFGGVVKYDIGYTDPDVLSFTVAEPDYDLYLFTGDSVSAICKEFRSLIGRSYIPPRWAFGFGQSRWGYKTADDVRAVAAGYRDNDMPLDMIYMDIDYMQDFADFTIDRERFPDLAALSAEMKAQGIRLVPIIDAGIKELPGESTYEEGIAKGYFCKKEDGTPFVGAVWPGHACFADFLRPEVRHWFGMKYKVLTDAGIEGFWNDMNEPAIFYTPERLAVALKELSEMQGKNLGVYDYFHLKDLVLQLSNHPGDYASFYHEVNGERVRHNRIHNLYGYNMTRAAGEAFEELRPGQRTLMFSRASCIGAHRYGGIWLGDNNAWWAHLKQNIVEMPGVQMCGFLFSGADLGGFGSNSTADLVLRWTQFAIFTPLMRNHSALGTRDQEFYRFTKQIPAFRQMLRLRYAMLPYLYSEFVKAALHDEMTLRPLAFEYPQDADAREVEDQLLVGDGLMVAPVYTQNATGRYVYLPEPMKLLRLRGVEDFDEEILPAGHHYVRCGLEEVLIFVRPGHLVPIAKPALCADTLDYENLTFWDYLPDGQTAEYTLYTDDGVTTDYEKPEHWKVLRK